MDSLNNEINEIVRREQDAWEMKDAELLLTVFHRDMVWAWPRDFDSLNPFYWQMDLGRFDHELWLDHWTEFFRVYDLIDAVVKLQKVSFSVREDAAFAVVDLNVHWENQENGEIVSWKGRVCKIYSKVRDSWKLISQTGMIPYRT